MCSNSSRLPFSSLLISLKSWNYFGNTTHIVYGNLNYRLVRCISSKVIHDIKSSDEVCEKFMKKGHFIVFYKSSFLCESALVGKTTHKNCIKWVNYTLLQKFLDDMDLCIEDSPKVFLGIGSEKSVDSLAFGIQLAPLLNEKKIINFSNTINGTFQSKELHMFYSKSHAVQMMLKANSLFRWSRNNNYCSRCGSSMRISSAGCKKQCVKCGEKIYCQGTPTINVLLVENNERVLLVRMPQFPKNFYSVVSGYVDIGESLEEAVKREVQEELGIEILRMKYINSLPWMMRTDPLMMGFIAHINSGQTLDVNTDEIADVIWINRTEILDYYTSKDSNSEISFYLPPEGTLSHKLLQSWINSTKNHQ